jgi:hypothetical protein
MICSCVQGGSDMKSLVLLPPVTYAANVKTCLFIECVELHVYFPQHAETMWRTSNSALGFRHGHCGIDNMTVSQ